MNNKELEKLLKDDKYLDEYLDELENCDELISINENASLLDNVLKAAEKEELLEMQKLTAIKKERSKAVRGFTKFIKIAFAATCSFVLTLGITRMQKIEMPEKNETNDKINEIYENYSNFLLTQIDYSRLVNRSENTDKN